MICVWCLLEEAEVAVGKPCSQSTLEFAQSGALRVKMLSWKADLWIYQVQETMRSRRSQVKRHESTNHTSVTPT